MEANDPVKSESTKTIKLHIKRQDSPEAKSRYEDFEDRMASEHECGLGAHGYSCASGAC